ncbi:MAG: sulfurtransferase [Woeseiaceae bacterium]
MNRIQSGIKGKIPPMDTYKNLVSVGELEKLIDRSACRIVDCRFDLMQPDKGRDDYAEAHIPGAVYAHLDRDLASEITSDSGRHPLPTPADFNRLLTSWGIEEGCQVVVYDYANGATAARLWWMMRWIGHDNVAVLNGGIQAWQQAGLSLSSEVPELEPVPFAMQPNSAMIATTAEIAGEIDSELSTVLIDARDRARFQGTTEPIDTVAGHIPGAVNLPFPETINADGTWLSLPELSELWQETIGEGAAAPVVAMCGSGVTACHLLLTAHLLDLTPPRLYVGSWSEWIRAADRPIASGS